MLRISSMCYMHGLNYKYVNLCYFKNIYLQTKPIFTKVSVFVNKFYIFNIVRCRNKLVLSSLFIL